MKLSTVMTQVKSSEYIDHPENEVFVTVSGKGKGVSRRMIGEGKTPVCFQGYRINAGQLIYSRIGASDGAFGIVPKELDKAVVSKDFPVFDVNESKVSKEYLLIYLCSDLFCEKAQKMSLGATMKRLKEETLISVDVEIPALDVQKEIVNKFTFLDEIIISRQNQLAKLDELVKSRFIELFGDSQTNPKRWKVEPAEKHIDLLSGFPFDSSQYTDDGVNICGGLIIMPQRIEWDECKHWRSVDGFENYTLKKNDIVIALDRPWITSGFKIAMVDEEHLPALLIQRTARIRATDINQHYLMYCFIQCGFDLHCNITGSLVPHISAKDIRSFPIMIPPMELQELFAAFVEQAEKSKLVIQESLAELETLKKALMQKYFG